MNILVEKHETIKFEREISRLNKRANKIGVKPLVATRIGEKSILRRSVTIMASDGDQSEEVRTYPCSVVEYDLQVPSLEEYRWVLAATLTPVEGGEVRTFVDSHLKGFEAKPWESVDPCRCQHCNSSRVRNLTYVVQNKDDGKQLQVGRNCFADYVGHDGLLKLEFQALVVAMFGGGDEDFCFPGGGGSKVNVVEVRRVVALAEALAELDGWKNNQKDEFGEIVAEGTHRLAGKMARGRLDLTKAVRAIIENEKHPIWAKVDEALAQIKEIDFAGEEDDFGRTLQYCANFEVIPSGKASLVAYLGQFLRNRAYRAELEAKKAFLVHVGTIGKREEFKGLTLRKLLSFDSQFGITYVHIFADPAGNQLVWKTGNPCAKEGETVGLKATVKEHGERNGAKQTVLSRCKVL